MIKGIWRSRYDYPGMSNTDQYFGRELHRSDNSLFIAYIAYFLLLLLLRHCYIQGDFNFHAISDFLNIMNLQSNYF